MATAQFAQMGAIPLKADLDMDTFFDFNQSTALNSPQTPSAPSRLGLTPHPTSDAYSNNAPSPFDSTEERQVFTGPSHEYERFEQQTGYGIGPVGPIPSINAVPDSFNPSHAFSGGLNSGIDDMFSGFNDSWSTGLDMDADVNMDFNAAQHHPTMFYPAPIQSRSRSAAEFVDPSSIGGQEEPQSNVGRLWPGMHQQQAQQAAMAKAQAQAQAQAHARQQRMHFEAQQQQQQHQQQQQQQQQHQQHQQQQQQQMRLAQQQRLEVNQNAGRSRATSYQSDAHTEESISRLLNQMRQNSAVPSMAGDDSLDGGMLPHVSRMRKEEEEMDEDERLLASEEGKKLSSKERRQLRNKVSARAFRSRRKEYISQLEGEVAMKAQEASDLKTANRSLVDENTRYRSLIETLLRHPAYAPFIEDFGKDPAVLAPSHQLAPSSMAPTPGPAATPSQDVKTDERKRGMSMLDAPVDLSMLNLNNGGNGNSFSVPSNAGINFSQPRMY